MKRKVLIFSLISAVVFFGLYMWRWDSVRNNCGRGPDSEFRRQAFKQPVPPKAVDPFFGHISAMVHGCPEDFYQLFIFPEGLHENLEQAAKEKFDTLSDCRGWGLALFTSSLYGDDAYFQCGLNCTVNHQTKELACEEMKETHGK